VVFEPNDCCAKAEFVPPVVFELKAPEPNAWLFAPLVFDVKALVPKAVLVLTLPPPLPTVRP